MTAVAIFSGSYCQGETVAELVATELGSPLVRPDEVIKQAAARHAVPVDRLDRILKGAPSLMDSLRKDQHRLVAYLREAVAELLQQGDRCLVGPTLHLVPRAVTHLLKVCLIANRSFRVSAAMRAEGVSERKARKLIERDDRQRVDWTQYLHGLGPWDERLYDMIVAMQSTGAEEAAARICENARKPALAATATSQIAAQDFLLAARVQVALAEAGHDVDVSASAGMVTVMVKRVVLREEALEEELRRIASAQPGVQGAQTRLGPKARPRAIYPELDIDSVPRVLLVDDEKEFVHTLSERLEARDLGAAVAYNGEDALSFVESEPPEVMVLDLKMPGIDGLEVLRRVKLEHPEVEVIILTGHGSEVEEARARELGAFAYLQKPVDIELLAQTMRDAYRKVNRARATAPGGE